MLGLKRLGFSMDEIARMTMADFIIYTDLAYSNTQQNKNTVRDATQADIDRLCI